jgi:hypothetical protein
VDPGSVHVPATHWAAAGAVVAQPVAQVVVVVPGSHDPGVEPPLLLDPAPSIPEASSEPGPVVPPPLVDEPLLPFMVAPEELLLPWLPPPVGDEESADGVVPQAGKPTAMPSAAATTEVQ